ncbi:hypothetical protein HOM13_01685 [Candidatus Woesearchaeota archaeon]|nr:hypothetical protein [Candidatus Woesearchaeota archaeon]MBT5215427.1 hypothetical protein [Candidatus Woesearchaeota archaeon]MBT6402042.1 hypothetical protein [Candidatus Woesearchaeota archaeon]
MNINISVEKRHLYVLSVLVLAFGAIVFVQGQGVSNFGHTADQIDGLDVMFTGMIGMFDSDCPIGWTRYSELDGKFPRGDIGANVGLEGGSNEYRVHTYGSGADCCSGTVKVASIKFEWKDESSSQVGVNDGAWKSGPWAVHEPSYTNVVYCTKD